MNRARLTESPIMRLAREEMRDMECHGPQGKLPCGGTVALACPRCGCHRCEGCVLRGDRCPMCVVTDVWWNDRHRADAGPVLLLIPGGAP